MSTDPNYNKPTSTEAPKRSLGGKHIPQEILRYIPEDSALTYKVAPIGIKDGVLEIGIIDPDNIEARNAVSFIADRLGMPYQYYQISKEDFKGIVDDYKGLTSEVNKALGELDAELAGEEQVVGELARDLSDDKGVTLVEDAPVSKIVAVIIRHATDGNASDIHIEPVEDKVRVRFRVDGILYTSLLLPKSVHEAVVARIKIICSMKLDEKRQPQDSRFSAPIDGRRVDFRVSSLPSYYGEKIVIRILDSHKGVKRIDEIGLTPEHNKMIREALAKPYGMILVTGPTGSGKSTSLYAMLNEVDREKLNVISLEDPVEYSVSGVNQSQVRPEIGYTFANGLRSILRQDPDVIMVGEIRDKETAQLAIQAALTGHLVLSTLHTNNAVGVIPRLVDMGVDPYLIGPTLVLVVAQRLVRTLCDESKIPDKMDDSVRKFAESQMADLPADVRSKVQIPDQVYHIKPSPTCPSGTRGRMAVFEMYSMDRGLEKLILSSPSDADIYSYVRGKGMLTIKEDAMFKAFKGLIPFEEVNTV